MPLRYGRYLVNYVLSFGYDLWYLALGDVRSRIAGLAYYRHSKEYPGYLKHGNMAAAVRPLAAQYCAGRGVDIGASRWPLPGARPVEDTPEEDAHRLREADGSLDFVFSSHTLEHLDDWQGALRHWHAKLKPGGVLFLYLPHEVCSMWQPGINPAHRWAPSPPAVADFLGTELGMRVVHSTSEPDGLLSFVVVARK